MFSSFQYLLLGCEAKLFSYGLFIIFFKIFNIIQFISSSSSSDIRLKRNLRPISESVLDLIDNIRTVKYNNLTDDRDYYGFIAQDFKENFPELLSRNNQDANYSLAYDRTTVILMQCIKELKQQNKELNDKLELINNKL